LVFLHQYLLVEIWQVLVINNRPVGRGVTGLLRFLFDQAGFLGHKGGNKVLPFLDSVRRRDPIRIEPDFFFCACWLCLPCREISPHKVCCLEPIRAKKGPKGAANPLPSHKIPKRLVLFDRWLNQLNPSEQRKQQQQQPPPRRREEGSGGEEEREREERASSSE
jgi:hypothetical protein